MILAALSLGFFSMAYGIDPPEKMWDETYQDGGIFYDIEMTTDTCLILAAHHSHFFYAGALQKVDMDGNMIWQAGEPTWWFHNARNVEVLPNGGFVAVGECKIDENKTYQLFIMYVTAEGNVQWSHVYDDTTTVDVGYDVCPLPDGGYAIAGKGHGQAWILRTDANGDTLWTDVWGTHTINFAVGVEYDEDNDWIVALTYGRSDSLINRGPHLLYYAPDGEYLFGTTYPELYPESAIDLCRFSDGDYGFVSRYGGTPATISRTDYLGELIWSETIGVGFGYGDPYGMDRTVLDDGCIVTGHAVEGPYRGNLAGWARFIRYDGEGNEMWNIAEAAGTDFRAALQLPQGGYMAVGSKYGDGYLVRYAPETGIEGPVSPGGSGLLRPVTPNPSSSMFHVSLDLPEAMNVRLEVFDTAGRRVGLLADGLLGAGEQSFSWDASGLSSGCYLVRLSGAGVCETRRCVLLR